ncbi:hypothetical protein ACRVDI_18090, partial [Acinetobacter baumannii]
MDILKFLRSFNTVGTYLAMATIVANSNMR